MPLYLRLALRSFFHQKGKAFLMIGAFLFCFISVGTLLNSNDLFEQLVQKSRQEASIADITYYTGLFDKNIDFAASMPEVKIAEAKTQIRSRAKLDGTYMNLQVQILPESPFAINKMEKAGSSLPDDHEIWIEATTAGHTGLDSGEKMEIILPQNQKSTVLSVTKTVRDPSKIPAKYSGSGYGYLSAAAAKKLDIPLSKNMIHVVLEDGTDRNEALRNIRKHLEDNGITVYRSEMSSDTFFMRETLMNTLFTILLLLGLFGSVLGFILIVHLFYRILSEDAYSLSIQKVTGAGTSHLWRQYALLIFVIGMTVSIISLPVISLFSRYLVSVLFEELNFGSTITGWLSPKVALTLVIFSFILPLAGAVFPVRRLISSPIGEGLMRSGQLNMKKAGRSRRRFFHLSLLSFRNLSAKKAQSIMNIVMLSFGGAVILACYSLHQSLQQEMNQTENFWQHDVEWSVKSPLPADEITSLAGKVEGIRAVEGWTKRNTEIITSSDQQNALLYSLPASSDLIKPGTVNGSWLKASQPDGIVINTELVERLGPLKPGDTVKLRIGKDSREWKIAGIMKHSLTGPAVYMDQDAYQQWLGQESVNRLLAVKHKSESTRSLLAEGEQKLSSSGVLIEGSETAEDITSRPKEMIGLIVWTIACTGILFAAVGTANLMIASSISIFERTKEIGILRSLGASNTRIYGLFIGESILTALLGWALACILSWPLSDLLGREIGDSLLHFSLQPGLSKEGSFLLLAASILIGAASGIVPVKRTLRKRINEIL
ncbi:FtsX-like permease family protein [Metabacillus idriensis]|uniref:FtsX-like permease family protein n=1 Tax=Metabacillus idriensis TaxID=324768 RepID=UPI003D28FBC3